MADWTLADWEEWNAEVDAKLEPEWVKKYGRQSFESCRGRDTSGARWARSG
jgi:hypothetical protein